MSTTGWFCWHDLMATDPDASQAFFTELFGWKVQEVDMGPMGIYRLLSAGETGLGGIVPLDEKTGAPPHWIGYVAVDDVDAALKRGEEHGGRICVPGTDIPSVGRFGVLTDPGGAVISPYRGLEEMSAPEAPPGPGHFCWDELLTRDVAGARAFYGEVFGWTPVEHDMGEMGTYTCLTMDGKDRAGVMQMPPEAGDTPPHWLSYIAVEDVDHAAARATELGGKILCAPMDIPGIGRFAVAADPTGALFALFRGV